jgi:hypothetical protein
MRKLRSLTTTLRKAIRGSIVKTCARAARGIKPVRSKVMNSRRFKCLPSGRRQIPYHAVACNAALCITAKQALMSEMGPSETSTAHCGRASDDGLPTLLWNRGFRCFTSSNFMLSSAVWLHTDQTYPHMRPMPPSSPYDPWPAARRRPCRRRSGSCQRIHQVDDVAGIAVSRPFVPARACASWLSSSTSAFS